MAQVFESFTLPLILPKTVPPTGDPSIQIYELMGEHSYTFLYKSPTGISVHLKIFSPSVAYLVSMLSFIVGSNVRP